MSPHHQLVVDLIRGIVATGETSLDQVLRQVDGADPRLVSGVLEEILARADRLPSDSTATAAGPSPRGKTARLPLRMPAADPGASQWWFSLDTADRLARRVRRSVVEIDAGRAVFLGAPTVGYRYAQEFDSAIVLDLDPHVVAALSAPDLRCQTYDVVTALPKDFHASASVVFMDPPWYVEYFEIFFSRAFELLKPGGDILCTLPPRLTRPGVVEERAHLLSTLVGAGCQILQLDRREIEYVVPTFEAAAFADLPGFDGRPWRYGDLLHVRTGDSSPSFAAPKIAPDRTKRFARDPQGFRVFLGPGESASDDVRLLQPVARYGQNVSRRANSIEPDLWTSSKKGFLLRNREIASRVLELWADCLSRADTVAALGGEVDGVADVVSELDEQLGLWSSINALPLTGAWALDDGVRVSASRREHGGKPSEFRSEFARDRDRIVWSSGLRSLGNKTQLFPVEDHDRLRQRLTHSLEVAQLATTLAASLDLDRDLVEAGALAHDIGHTPFGHAGEVALNRLLNKLDPELGGFNHYEHGVDVLRWLEDAYQSAAVGGHPGLNLTPEVTECVFKHTFCHSGAGESLESILSRSKNADLIVPGRCHLEGQAVRLADKISYLISDVEDGILLGAITPRDIERCRLFHRPPIDTRPAEGESLYEWFVAQRRALIEVLMEDAIQTSKARLVGVSSLEDVRRSAAYMVDHSESLSADVGQVWTELQVKKLHADGRVRRANMLASKKVAELTILFAIEPDLIDSDFRARHVRLHGGPYLEWYRQAAGRSIKLDPRSVRFARFDLTIGHQERDADSVPTERLVMAKDYVAGLTDQRAQALHASLVG